MRSAETEGTQEDILVKLEDMRGDWRKSANE
jgi:hypothetical protein